jgi:hypothetical protein
MKRFMTGPSFIATMFAESIYRFVDPNCNDYCTCNDYCIERDSLMSPHRAHLMERIALFW